MNKRGQTGLSDGLNTIIEYSGFLIVFVIVVLLLGVVLFNFATEVESTGLPGTSEDENPMIKFAKNYPERFDWIPIVVYILLLTGSIAISINIPFGRGYIIIAFLLIIITSVMLMFVANFLTYMIELSSFSVIRDQLVIIPLMAKYHLVLGMIFMILNSIALLYNK